MNVYFEYRVTLCRHASASGACVVVTAKLKNTRNILRSPEFFLICCETATIFSMASSLSASAVALAAEQARPEAWAGAGLRDSALTGEGSPVGLLPPCVPSFTQLVPQLTPPPVFHHVRGSCQANRGAV